MSVRYAWLLAMVIPFGVAAAGCGKSSDVHSTAVHDDHDHDHDAPVDPLGHSLGGWWCDEHGVPEAECALCDSKLVAGFKAKGDWCDMHNRPDSQCFACHPDKEAEYAALYEAKAGKKPPKPTGNGA